MYGMWELNPEYRLFMEQWRQCTRLAKAFSLRVKWETFSSILVRFMLWIWTFCENWKNSSNTGRLAIIIIHTVCIHKPHTLLNSISTGTLTLLLQISLQNEDVSSRCTDLIYNPVVRILYHYDIVSLHTLQLYSVYSNGYTKARETYHRKLHSSKSFRKLIKDIEV